MSMGLYNSDHAWAGLLIDTPHRAVHEEVLREIMGDEPVLLVVRESDSLVDGIRRVLQSRSPSILSVAGDDQAPALAPLLKAAGSLSSLRRIVVLHDTTIESAEPFRQHGVLMLRDCPETRRALRDLVARECGSIDVDSGITPHGPGDAVAKNPAAPPTWLETPSAGSKFESAAVAHGADRFHPVPRTHALGSTKPDVPATLLETLRA